MAESFESNFVVRDRCGLFFEVPLNNCFRHPVIKAEIGRRRARRDRRARCQRGRAAHPTGRLISLPVSIGRAIVTDRRGVNDDAQMRANTGFSRSVGRPRE
jgi:hypothetical protein